MHQTELSLSRQDRRTVDEFRAKGLHRAREFNRAHILAALDRKIGDWLYPRLPITLEANPGS